MSVWNIMTLTTTYVKAQNKNTGEIFAGNLANFNSISGEEPIYLNEPIKEILVEAPKFTLPVALIEDLVEAETVLAIAPFAPAKPLPGGKALSVNFVETMSVKVSPS